MVTNTPILYRHYISGLGTRIPIYIRGVPTQIQTRILVGSMAEYLDLAKKYGSTGFQDLDL